MGKGTNVGWIINTVVHYMKYDKSVPFASKREIVEFGKIFKS